MTYHDHGHPIKTNTYKLACKKDINIKRLGYDHMGYLRWLRKRIFTWSNLTSNHGNQLITNAYDSAKTYHIDCHHHQQNQGLHNFYLLNNQWSIGKNWSFADFTLSMVPILLFKQYPIKSSFSEPILACAKLVFISVKNPLSVRKEHKGHLGFLTKVWNDRISLIYWLK